MDKDKRVIQTEAAKLGKPASHGCIRLGVDDAYWFYTVVPDGSHFCVLVDFDSMSSLPDTKEAHRMDKAGVSAWLAAYMEEYRQAYALSCEIALIRASLGVMGIRDVSEDDILATIPRGGTDPERAFVCDDIQGGRRNADGSIHWNNYGAHPPVVVAELMRWMAERGVADRYVVREMRADDAKFRLFIVNDPSFLGAIVWLVGHPESWGLHPQVNERGMVLGEHVRFLEPALTADGRFRLWDPETGKLILAKESGVARDLFSFRVVGIFTKK